MPYLASLDGIRAIAIIAVLIFHVSPVALRGGFTGVDVFYVLSGFLITSIILHDIREGSFSLREFYARRIQRLLPNVVVTVLAVILLWTLLMPPSTARQTGTHGLWTLFSLSNIYIWKNLGGYWGSAAEWAPLTHTWSLGIEEQFYLIFPSALLLLARFQSGRLKLWLILATAISFGLCLYESYLHPTSTFFLLPTRLWELLLGAVLAAHRTSLAGRQNHPANQSGVRAREAMGWAGLLMFAAGFFLISGDCVFPGWVSLAPTVGTVLLLVSVTAGESRVSRMMSLPFMVKIGALSYSIYLWHWPLITLGKIEADLYGIPRLAGAVAGGIAGLVLAALAYYFVEQPLRKRGPGRPMRFAAIGAGFSLVAACAFFVSAQHPVADRLGHFDPPAFCGKLYDAGRPAETDPSKSVRYYDVQFPPLPARPKDAWKTGGIIHSYGGGNPKVVVLGSSHALMYSRLIDDICREMGLSVAFLGVDAGTPAFFETKVNPNFATSQEAAEFDEARKKWLKEWHPEAVIAIDRWDLLPGAQQEFDGKLHAFLKVVSPLAGRVIFVSQIPVLRGGGDVNLREFVSWRMGKSKDLPRLETDDKEGLRKRIVAKTIAAEPDFANLRVLRPDLPFYNQDGSILYASGRTFYYADDNHLTDAGTEVVRKLFRQAIAEAHQREPQR